MKKKVLLLMLSFVLISTNVFGAELPDYPEIEGVMITEQNSGDVIFSQNENERYFPASTTKLMTALVAVEHGDVSEIITVDSEIEDIDPASSIADLAIGEKLSLKDLLYGLLLPSGNDAANTIALNIGRKIADNLALESNEAIDVFVNAMNEKAASLEMTGTHFMQPHGLYNSEHYSTPADLIALSKAAFSNEIVKEVSRTKSHKIKTNLVEHDWFNSNLMLYPSYDDLPEDWQMTHGLTGRNPAYNPYATSAKTGFVEEGGRCLVFGGESNGKNVIGVILNSEEFEIFEESSQSLTTVIEGYDFIRFTNEENNFKDIEVKNNHIFDPSVLKVRTDIPMINLVPKDKINDYRGEIVWDTAFVEENPEGPFIKANIESGEKVGELQIYNGETVLESTPLYAATTIQTRKWFDYLFIYWYLSLAVLLVLAGLIAVLLLKKKFGERKKKFTTKKQASDNVTAEKISTEKTKEKRMPAKTPYPDLKEDQFKLREMPPMPPPTAMRSMEEPPVSKETPSVLKADDQNSDAIHSVKWMELIDDASDHSDNEKKAIGLEDEDPLDRLRKLLDAEKNR